MRQLKITNSITSRGSQSLEDYLNDISKQPLLTAEEEVKLAQRIRNDDREALERLVCANLRFVVSVAKQYQNQGLTLPDLINEGNIGLIKAAEKFDETRGFKFISYAVWWIRQSILQALAEQSRMVRLPLNQVSAVSRINKLITKFEQEHERKPSADELSELIDETPEKIRDSLRANGRPMSMDAPLGDGDDSTLLEVISDDNMPSTDGRMIDTSLATEIDRMLDTLDEREKTIVEMCFGINNREMTLEEISEKFGLSRERVRQIREKALLKLRHSNKKSLLQEYLG
ncbi:MAG: RNA polymerase sigma factor RpoD/SigA [Bacteroidaceae bacterium]|nr:RNA polymerase sigma factor RpoD/SigA [Prevotellaceae bacterium]MDD7658708.1 RNA polymerase sigma factor RpoD/SigA [Prevotellaceae bacterium]MDY5598684.1 RNA polymerase sigma factor RpoD/SigA [Bacteroidaceae bacterium]